MVNFVKQYRIWDENLALTPGVGSGRTQKVKLQQKFERADFSQVEIEEFTNMMASLKMRQWSTIVRRSKAMGSAAVEHSQMIIWGVNNTGSICAC